MLTTNPTPAEMAGGAGPDGPATLRHPSPVKTPARTLLMTTITAGAVSSPSHQALPGTGMPTAAKLAQGSSVAGRTK